MSTSNNERIAKNTLLLYIRTLLVMVVSLFTSRVILNALGVEDYGIYNVIGGIVAMFSVISGTLSSSISRFLTFELGKGYSAKLNEIFSTSINIQICLSLIILILGEIVGLCFLNYKINIPTERLYAANWVLQCSLLTFIINLISIPYNAAIIAHEKMSAFAYISILEVALKLIVTYLCYVSPVDKLITYSILLVCVSIVIRITYGIYCNYNFEETIYKKIYDRTLIKEMAGFAGWSFFTNCAYIFNTQGVNILINLFFGVGMNAARGIAVQIETAIKKFVIDFTTAINPQITKNYAAGNMEAMYKLICRGSKFSYLLMFCLSLPFLFETPTILKLWLNIVPEHTTAFFRLSIIGTLIDLLGNTGYTACMATGKIKKYVLFVTSIGCMVFPLSWMAYRLGMPVESCYVIFAIIYLIVDIVRLRLMRQMIGFPPMMFVKDVFMRILFVTILSVALPAIVVLLFDSSLYRMFANGCFCLCSALLCSFFAGLDKGEKQAIRSRIFAKIRKR